MEITAFKVKSRILPVLTFDHFNLNILSYRSPFDANSKTYQPTKFQQKTSSYERDMLFLR